MWWEGRWARHKGVSLPLLQWHRHGEFQTQRKQQGRVRGPLNLRKPFRAKLVSSQNIYCTYYCVVSTITIFVAPSQESISTGPFMMKSMCRRCGGRGSIIITPCILCRGTGQTKKRQTVTVPVPAGRFSHIRDRGSQICLTMSSISALFDAKNNLLVVWVVSVDWKLCAPICMYPNWCAFPFSSERVQTHHYLY